MQRQQLEICSDYSDTDSLHTEYVNPLVQYGFNHNARTAGSTVHFDLYRTAHFQDLIPYDDFEETILYATNLRIDNNFRNIVLMIGSSTGSLHRHVAFSRDNLLRHGEGNILDGISTVLQNITEGNIIEMYEDYEKGSKDHLDLYGETMNSFNLVTSYFGVVYGRPREEAGGIISDTQYTKYLKIEMSNNTHYGVYDCFFQCVDDILDLCIDVDSIRSRIKVPKGMITIRSISRFERLTKTNVIVYSDNIEHDENGVIRPKAIYQSSCNYERRVELVLFQEHYYVYKGLIPSEDEGHEENDARDNTTGSYVFYDFETYMDPRTFIATPYAMSYCVVNDGIQISSGCITKSSITEKDTQDFYTGVYNFFISHIEFGIVRLIGFNNGAFDDYILIDILSMFNKKLGKVLVDKTSKILSFHYKDMCSKDAYRFFITSLKQATKSFKCVTQKGEFKHHIVQEHVDENTYETWFKENKEALIDYALRDVVSLKELYFKALNMFKHINQDLDMDRSLTLSQMSMSAFSRSIERSGKRLPILDKHEDDTIRQALIGGRCQIFDACDEYNHELQCIDVVSLYPYVMINKKYPYIFEDSSYKPDSKKRWFKRCNRLIEGKIGIYETTIHDQPTDAIIPMKHEDGTLNWTPELPFTRWIDSITLNCLRRHNGSFTVHKGYVFDLPMDYIFKDYLDPIMTQKMEQDRLKDQKDPAYNPAMRECLKLLMNSLSGKMGQRPIVSEKTICDSGVMADELAKKYGDSASFIPIRDKLFIVEGDINEHNIRVKSPTILAIMIYAYAREYMYDNFITKVHYKYGMDTDSLFLRSSEIHRIDSALFGDDCGQVKIELPAGCHGVFAGKKMYSFYQRSLDGRDKIVKFKFKGIKESDKIIPDEDVIEIRDKIEKQDWKFLNKTWNSFRSATSLESLRNILQNKKIHVLCSQIVRNFKNVTDHDKSFLIRGRYMIKTFPNNLYADEAV